MAPIRRSSSDVRPKPSSSRCHLASLRIEPVPRSTHASTTRLHDAEDESQYQDPSSFNHPSVRKAHELRRNSSAFSSMVCHPVDGVRIRPEPVLLTLDLLPAARSIRTVGQLQLSSGRCRFPTQKRACTSRLCPRHQRSPAPSGNASLFSLSLSLLLDRNACSTMMPRCRLRELASMTV